MKSPQFTSEAQILKAMSNPKRLEIIALLGQHTLSATEIQQMTGFPQANLSQHLRALKLGHVIVAQREGQHIRYRLSHPGIMAVTAQLRTLLRPTRVPQQGKRVSVTQDPVCQMWVEPAAARFESIYKGATYFFCASGCQRHFMRQPERYV